MSEYQYYEFQAIDRPLSSAEMAALRACSTRATITPTRFVNSYSYGQFKGDERRWMERYFDAFLYLANWGTRHLSLRLPAAMLPLKEARQYCCGGAAEVRQRGRHLILELSSDDEGGGDWVEEENGMMASLVALRGELASGDLRPLYLAWLGRAQADELEPNAAEPPPPPGLGALTAPQEALADFLRLDHALIAAAASGSPPLATVTAKDLRTWVRKLREPQRSDLLLRFLSGEREGLRSKVLRDLRRAGEPARETRRAPRTVAALVEMAAWCPRAKAASAGPARRGARA